MSALEGRRIHITGIVQGVGFRPFVYGLATHLALTGWVRNTSAGVDIEANGPAAALEDFVEGLKQQAPPLARIDELQVEPCEPDGFSTFEILHSEAIAQAFQPISPDVTICPDCLQELFDPADRRYLYPFINCTNCGPRFTIIQDIPYDRPNTTMSSFPLCPDCAAEYADPLDRRFHAQPVACPVCGPHVWLEEKGAVQPAAEKQEAMRMARRRLAEGSILAVKGLGGFHLACDARNSDTVEELRRRKLRVDKPFALMMPDLETIERHCLVSPWERAALESRERPIVILTRRPESNIAAAVAPHQSTLGVMLPYTPLHYLLFHPEGETETVAEALVMTSGNLSEEPIATGNDEARRRLAPLADAFLLHDRPIETRCDDAVVRIFPDRQAALVGEPHLIPLRRSRGYAPYPIRMAQILPPLLATGAELKNTFCLARDRYAFLSHHIGDLENYETLQSYEESIEHFERLFRIKPLALAHDLHPDYLSTRYAFERAEAENLPLIGVQHHHAHITSCMAEHGLSGDFPVIGLSFDGTGYGDDGRIWGGEVLIADYRDYRRAAHLRYAPLPGGDAAVREPWRMALSWLYTAGIPWQPGLAPVRHAESLATLPAPISQLEILRHQIEHGVNAPQTSSLGRLFDAAAALAGVRQVVNYEAQAAIEFENLVDPHETVAYPFELDRGSGPWLIQPAPMFAAFVADLQKGTPAPVISARFHNGLAQVALEVCQALRKEEGLRHVALSGGVWQNFTLLHKTAAMLNAAGFTVLIHRQVPPNDGGLALGQVLIAAQQFMAS